MTRDVRPFGSIGEIPFGVCKAECPTESSFREFLSGIWVSEALPINPPYLYSSSAWVSYRSKADLGAVMA